MSNTPKDFKGWFGAQNHQSKPPSKSGKPPPIPETHTPPKPKSKRFVMIKTCQAKVKDCPWSLKIMRIKINQVRTTRNRKTKFYVVMLKLNMRWKEISNFRSIKAMKAMKAYGKTSNAVKMNLSRGIKKIATILWLLENHHQRIDFGIKD